MYMYCNPKKTLCACTQNERSISEELAEAMGPTFVVAMLAFSVSPPPSLSRREAALFFAASATFVPCAAFAELYGEGKAPKVAEAQSIANAEEGHGDSIGAVRFTPRQRAKLPTNKTTCFGGRVWI